MRVELVLQGRGIAGGLLGGDDVRPPELIHDVEDEQDAEGEEEVFVGAAGEVEDAVAAGAAGGGVDLDVRPHRIGDPLEAVRGQR